MIQLVRVVIAAILVAAAMSSCSESAPNGVRDPAIQIETGHNSESTDRAPAQPASGKEWAARMAECLANLDWEIDATGSSLRGELPNDQQMDVLQEDIRQCEDAVVVDPEAFYSDEYIAREYELRISVAECVERLGYPVSKPPSLQVFTEDTLNKIPSWDPHFEVFEGDGFDAGKRAMSKCPLPEPFEILNQVTDDSN